MNKLIVSAVLIIFGPGLRAESTSEKSLALDPTRDKIFNAQEELDNDFRNSLLEFAKNHFNKYKISILLVSKICSICDNILEVLMNASTQPFVTLNDIASTNYSVLENSTDVISHIGFYKSIVFSVENVSEFFKYLTMVRSMYAYNPRAVHLILTVDKPTDEELEMIFEECWSQRILNVGLIACNEEDGYTYNPYKNNQTEMLEKMRDWSGLFYDKLHNMYRHKILTKFVPFSGTDKVKWIEEESRYKFFGSDFGYATAFFRSANATLKFLNLTDATVPMYKNYKFRSAIWNERKFNGAEIWMNFMPLQLVFRERSERSYPLRRDSLKILAPKSGSKIPSIFEPYNNITWTSVVISLIGFALYSRALYKWRRVNDSAFFRTWGIFLGKNLPNRRLEVLEKFTFLVFTMASLIILSAYQGALYGALATVSEYPEIDTMSQLHKKTKTIAAAPVIAEFFRKFVEPGITVRSLETDKEYIEYMKIDRDIAYTYPRSIASYTSRLKYLSENGVPYYHMMSGYSVPGYVSHTFPYGSPYLAKFERVYLACKEAGLDHYWEAEVALESILTGKIIPDVPEGRKLKKLSLESQLYGFYILGIGLLVSSISFVGEVYFYKYYGKISRINY